jgi:hypothetical protein
MVSRNVPSKTPGDPKTAGGPKTSDAPKTLGAAAAQSAQPQSGAHQPFEDAATQYLAAITQVNQQLQERQQNAAKEYLESVQHTAQPTETGGLVGAYQDLATALQGLDPERIKGAQWTYLERLKTLQSDAASGAKTAYDNYLAALKAAWDATQAEAQGSRATSRRLKAPWPNCRRKAPSRLRLHSSPRALPWWRVTPSRRQPPSPKPERKT